MVSNRGGINFEELFLKELLIQLSLHLVNIIAVICEQVAAFSRHFT